MSFLLQIVLPSLILMVVPAELDTARADTPAAEVRAERQASSMQLGLQPSITPHSRDSLFAEERMRVECEGGGRKSPAGALLLSLGSTAVPAGVGVYLLHRDDAPARWIGGVAVAGGGGIGPSAGHFYACNSGQAQNGIAVRGGAGLVGGLAAWGLVHTIDPGLCPDSETCDRASNSVLEGVLVGVFLGAGATVLLRTVYDLATTWRVARNHNSSRDLSVRPTLNPLDSQAGLALHWTF